MRTSFRAWRSLSPGNAEAAVTSFRRALYVDPSFGLAAFNLGCAHDARGDVPSARRAYQQALRTLSSEDDQHRAMLDRVDLDDIEATCRMRLGSGG